MFRSACAAGVCLLLSPIAASAQERGQVGVTMGYPNAVGVIWHTSDRLAIRPEITFNFASAESSDSFGGEAESSGTSFSIGGSALWYLGPASDNVRTYVSPRVTWGKADTDDDNGPENSHWTASASFGAQYAPVRRFSVFGEVGYGVSQSSVERQGFEGLISATNRSWGVRTAVGVVLYIGG
jgi:hypothetical protein